MSKTNYLQAVISDLQRTAGPYSMCHDAHSLKYRKDYSLVPRASATVNGGIKRVKWWPGVRGLRLMGCVKLTTQPSRIDSLTAQPRTRVLLASTLNSGLMLFSRHDRPSAQARDGESR